MLVCLAEEVKYTLELLNDLSLGVICAAQRDNALTRIMVKLRHGPKMGGSWVAIVLARIVGHNDDQPWSTVAC